MKNFITKIGFLLIALQMVFVTGVAGDRVVLIEFFTSSTCGPCGYNSPVMTAFINATNPESIGAIGFHMNWPAPGNDPMFLYNQTDNNTKRTYYGINSIPEARMDGSINVYPNYTISALQTYFDSRKNVYSPVSIIVRDSSFSTDSVALKVFVYCETFLTNPSVTINVGLLEDSIGYASPPGTNGEKEFHWVMRKMYPSANGTIITMVPGGKYYVEQKFKKDPVWNWNKMRYIAYVQDNTTKEILNSAKLLSNFSMIPYPAFKSVTQGVSGSGNFKVAIPYIAAGYNSAVTLSAAVEPVTSGINVTFPGSSVISSFPDSVALQVTSTAGVPTGSYKIIVTGTSASGKVHKTSVDYLVGKNIITVKTNPANLNFSIDGTAYGSTKIFDWVIGSTHALQATPSQIVDATKYVFLNWSNGGDTSQTITTSSAISDYTANYKAQFRMMMLTSPSGIPVTLTPGNNIYLDSSTTINGSVSPTQVSYNGKTYYFKRWVGTGTGSYTGTNPTFQYPLLSPVNQIAVFDTINIGISKLGDVIPSEYKVYQNYPNPFNPSTKIKFDVPANGLVSIKVFNILGEQVAEIFNGNLQPGKYETDFNAYALSSGVYFYKMTSENYSQILRMVLVK